MLRKLAVLAVLGVILATALGSAAALPFNGGTIQAGGTDSLACQPSNAPITAKWQTMTMGDGQFHVRGVELSGIDPACIGKFVLVALDKGVPTGSGANQIAFMRAAGAISGSSIVADQCFSGGWVACSGGSGPNAADVDFISVVFKNAFSGDGE